MDGWEEKPARETRIFHAEDQASMTYIHVIGVVPDTMIGGNVGYILVQNSTIGRATGTISYCP